jgi:hypothetical protein
MINIIVVPNWESGKHSSRWMLTGDMLWDSESQQEHTPGLEGNKSKATYETRIAQDSSITFEEPRHRTNEL